MEINRYIDHTNLKAFASINDIDLLIDEALHYNFKAVCIHPFYVAHAKKRLDGTNVSVCSVCGFPLGANTIASKVYEARELCDLGCDEVDYVLNIAALKMHDYDYLKKEMQALRDATFGRVLKVIIETCYLTEDEIIKVSELATICGVDFVKTSTGFAGAGAKALDVECISRSIGPNVSCKASGGIRTLSDLNSMIAAGANRIGTSNSVCIIKELNNE